MSHHLLQFLNPDQDFSVAEYVKLARERILDICNREKLPILAGGTGLYVSSLLDNITFFDTKSDPRLRQELQQTAAQKGINTFWTCSQVLIHSWRGASSK